MSLLATYALLVGIIFLYMSGFFALSRALKRNDIVDVAWGLGFVLIAWTSFGVGEPNTWRQWLLLLAVTLWGARLAGYIFIRSRGKGEDWRYEELQKKNKDFPFTGKPVLNMFVIVFMLQGGLMLLVAAPIVFINTLPNEALGFWDGLGIATFFYGLAVQSVADWELYRFKRDPNRTYRFISHGLWRYTRHPNYYGETKVWWGIWLMALGVSGGFWSIIGPLLITFLLLKVSGVPMLEEKFMEDPEFQQYASQVSRFAPLLPKSALPLDQVITPSPKVAQPLDDPASTETEPNG